MGWTELAACAPHRRPEGMTQAEWVDLFFPRRGASADPAKAVCEGCPVKAECLAESLVMPMEMYGIRGGLSVRQRRRIGSQPAPAQPRSIAHGTAYGYRRHLQDGTVPCALCRWAHREAERRRVGLEVAS